MRHSREYCRRVSEVILNTKAVPAFFNDQANIAALMGQGETIAHARDYAVIGSVELASRRDSRLRCRAAPVTGRTRRS